ncbi:hypothetical protein TNCT_507811 [Trichonephila clavata]|uniref:2-methoxy-6-polyprenyl-1,4-benzoquinol methylase, mitochondrial n=1 Tax=Trichonephila clavata TaxID=2740835 RepID=A0A8X6KD47_TRICU|nr:hypothetical protein TNCT_507811 [Trichonephila clavata]
MSTIKIKKKSQLVKEVFDSVASRYDTMNDIMSLGMHRLWKDKMVNSVHFTKNSKVLDVAGGTGDIAIRIVRKEPSAKVTVCDINQNMLSRGRDKAINSNQINFDWVCASAESLPFEDSEFDYCTIAFGIRNVSDRKKALNEAHRVLKPHGKFICLEFAPMHYQNEIFTKLYDLYSFKVIPKIGSIVAKDKSSYEYLVKSIREFPTQADFKMEIEERDNFQVTKSLEAFKRGQLTGVGPGEGSIKASLPDCHTDFVFSVLAEEFGLITCLATLMLFGIISARLLYVAYRENELFNLLVILGISIQFITQFIINIGVTLSVFPTTGITLPLLSYGGSSLLSSSIALGIMLSFSRNQAIALKFRERIMLGRYMD